MFASVTVPNLRAPSLLSVKLTAGRLFWSSDGRALVRSRPLTAAALRDHVVDRAAARWHPPRPARCPCPRAPGRCLHAGPHALAAGPCSTSFSSSRPVDRMISLARSTSVTPGSCTRIWSPSAPCCGDARLGDAQLVDAALDRLPRLRRPTPAAAGRDVRLHRERVAAVGPRAAIEVRRRDRRRPRGTRRPAPAARPSTRICRDRRHGQAGRSGCCRVRSASRSRSISCSASSRSASSVCTRSTRCTPPFRSRPSLSCFSMQPRRRRDAVMRGDDRIDADAREDHEDARRW